MPVSAAGPLGGPGVGEPGGIIVGGIPCTPVDPIPVVGDIVHYISQGGSTDFAEGIHRAAIVTAIPSVSPLPYLFVVGPNFEYRVSNVAYGADGKTPGTWHPKEMKHD